MPSDGLGRQAIVGRKWQVGGLVLLIVAGLLLQRSRTPGHVVQTLTLPYPPSGIAIDTRTGRAFVLLTSGDDRVAVLDTRTGHLLHLLGPFSLNASMAVDETTQRVFLDSGDGTVTVVDARDGRMLGTTLAGGDRSLIAVDERHARVIVTNPNGDSVDVLDARSGRLLHTIYLGLGAMPRGIAIDTRSGHVFVANPGTQTVSLLNPAAGTAQRILSAAHDPQVAVDARSARVLITTTGSFMILDASTGHLLTTIPVHHGSGDAFSVSVDGRTGYAFIGDDSSVHVLDVRTGRMIRTLKVALGMILMDDRLGRAIIVDGRQGTLNILNAGSGRTMSTLRIGVNPSWPVVDERTRRLYVTSAGEADATGNPIGNGTLSVVDVVHGALLRTSTAGVGPVAIALDERTDHAFIANTGGMVRVPDPWRWMPNWLRRWIPFVPAARSFLHHVPGSISMFDMAP